MNSEEIKSKLNLLTDEEREVLKVACEHPEHSDKDLSNDRDGGLGYLNWSSSKIRNLRREGMAAMRPYTPEQFCPYLLGKVDDELDIGPIVWNQVKAPKDFDEYLRELKDSDKKTVTGEGDPEKPTQRSSWLLPLLIGLGIITAICMGSIFYFTRQPQTREVIVEVTRIVSENIVVTSPPEVIEQTRIMPEEVTVEVTSLVEAPAVTEVPVTVAVTSEPTATLTPEAALLQSNFSMTEDFNDQDLVLPSEPIGNYTIRNGKLAVTDGIVRIVLGDETWRNYSVQYTHEGHSCVNASHAAVRTNNEDRFQLFYDGCLSRWSLIFNGEEVSLDKTSRNFQPTISIEVVDDKIYQTTNTEIIDVDNFDLESGGIEIFLTQGEIDNLTITRND